MTTFKTDDKVTVRVPVRLPAPAIGPWTPPFGALDEGEPEPRGRQITPGIQLWVEDFVLDEGIERLTVREADGNRFEVDASNLEAWQSS